jgi:hypothetical protein
MTAAKMISGSAVPATRRASRMGREGFGTQTPASRHKISRHDRARSGKHRRVG